MENAIATDAGALPSRWTIASESRQSIMARMVEIATSREVEPKESIAAFRAILEAERQNQDDQKFSIAMGEKREQRLSEAMTFEQRKARIAERIAALGGN